MHFCHAFFRLTFPIKSRDQIYDWEAGGALSGRTIAVIVALRSHQVCLAGHPADDVADADVQFLPAPVPVLRGMGDLERAPLWAIWVGYPHG